MSDFFIFSLVEILTSLRFLFVVLWTLSVSFLTLFFTVETKDAFIYGRFIRRKVGKVGFKDWWRFIRYCYKSRKHGVSRRWDDGSYWNGFDDWACIDRKSGKWISKGGQQ